RPPLSSPFPYTTLFRSPSSSAVTPALPHEFALPRATPGIYQPTAERPPPTASHPWRGRRFGLEGQAGRSRPCHHAIRAQNGDHADRKSTRLNSSHVAIS